MTDCQHTVPLTGPVGPLAERPVTGVNWWRCDDCGAVAPTKDQLTAATAAWWQTWTPLADGDDEPSPDVFQAAMTAALTAAYRSARVHPGLLRWCRWPGCWAHFNAANDEGLTPGWRRHRSDLECPAHADLGHWPSWRMAEGEGPRGIVAECRCGAEHPIPGGVFQAAEDWWDEHALSVSV